MSVTKRTALVFGCGLWLAGLTGCVGTTPSMGSVTRWIPRVSWPAADESPHAESVAASPRKRSSDKSRKSLSLEMARGRNLEKAGELDEAREVYQNLLAAYPHEAEVYHRLGVVADLQRRHKEAQQLFTQAITMSPREPLYFNDLGYCFFLQGKMSKAESALMKAVRFEPGNSRYHNNLGMVLGHQGRFPEAFEQFVQAGSEADAHYNMAFIHAALDQPQVAKQCFLHALAADPTHEKAREALQNFQTFEQNPESREQLAADGNVRWVPFEEGGDSSTHQVAQATALDAPAAGGPTATQAFHKGTQTLFNRNMRSERAADEAAGP